MELISEVIIENFRSLRHVHLTELGNFTALAGLNNSGKSNILRAMNLFFTGQPEPGLDLDLSRDHFVSKSKHKKEIKITVRFKLPEHFNFRKGRESVKTLLGRDFSLRKRWVLERIRSPEIGLQRQDDTDFKTLIGEDEEKARVFVEDMITFRYIPNHVQPSSLLRSADESVKEMLLRGSGAWGTSSSPTGDIFKGMSTQSRKMMEEIQRELKRGNPEIEAIALNLPRRLAEMSFPFKYAFTVKKKGNITHDLQGSGVQTNLAYHLLHRVDSIFYQSFGWKQATIWAVEEPESSLHTRLEAYLAAFFRDKTHELGNRLQVFCSTHSDTFVQYCSQGVYCQLDSDGSSNVKTMPAKELMAQCAGEGAMRHVPPLLQRPLEPIIIVEGPSDKIVLEAACKALSVSLPGIFRSLEELGGGGGAASIEKYLKDNQTILATRPPEGLVLVVLDWNEKDGLVESTQRALQVHPRSGYYRFRELQANPELDRNFTGIERFLSTSLIRGGETQGYFRLHRPSGQEIPLSLADRDALGGKGLDTNKVRFAQWVADNANADDFAYLRSALDELSGMVSNNQS